MIEWLPHPRPDRTNTSSPSRRVWHLPATDASQREHVPSSSFLVVPAKAIASMLVLGHVTTHSGPPWRAASCADDATVTVAARCSKGMCTFATAAPGTVTLMLTCWPVRRQRTSAKPSGVCLDPDPCSRARTAAGDGLTCSSPACETDESACEHQDKRSERELTTEPE